MFKSKAAKSAALEEAVRSVLEDPDWLEMVRVTPEGQANLILQADPGDMPAAEARRMETESKIRAIKGINAVNVALTAERKPSAPQPKPTPEIKMHTAPPAGTRRVRKGARLSDEAVSQGQPGATAPIDAIDGIKMILAVASAKGGVGKSTVAVNLAAALSKKGLNIGILDADVYGPSVPTMLGTVDADPRAGDDKKLLPIQAHGMKSLSIGYLTDPDAPMIWRGPIVMSAITQMLKDAAWGTKDAPIDLLIIDTPPGTGDAALTLAQRVPLTAAIIVTTPQEIALADVRRGAAMFAKTAVPVLGVVETMSWFEDPAGHRHQIFGEGGGRAMAQSLGLPLLAELPLLTEIRAAGDAGTPAALGDTPASALFAKLAERVQSGLETLKTKPAPQIIFED